MATKLTNNASAIIPDALSSTDTTITLDTGDGALFPTLGVSDIFYATLVSTSGTIEIVKCTARTDDTLTVVRAQEGTLAVPFPADSRLELRLTEESLRTFIQSL